MNCYDEAFRKVALEYIDGFYTQKQVSEMLKISPKTIYNWVKMRELHGHVAPIKHPKRKSTKLPLEDLNAFIKEHPDAYGREDAAHFNCSTSVVYRAFRKLALSFKKTLLYKERSEEKRNKYKEQIKPHKSENLVYIDESGIDEYLHRTHARAPRGERIAGEISGKRYARKSIVAAQCDNKIIAPFGYAGTCNANLFNFWVEKFLVPELKNGQTVVMDNAAIHKSKKTEELIKSAGCQLVYLPPYSPDLNPIEHYWANLKRKLRSSMKSFETLDLAILAAVNS